MTEKPSTKKTHGGARPGAGRPRRGETRVLFFQTTVAESTREAFFDAANAEGVSVGELLDQIAAQHLKKGRK